MMKHLYAKQFTAIILILLFLAVPHAADAEVLNNVETVNQAILNAPDQVETRLRIESGFSIGTVAIHVPRGKSIVLDSATAVTLSKQTTGALPYIFIVDEGGSLTIDGDITVDGALTSWLVHCAGSFTLNNGTLTRGGHRGSSNNLGSIYVHGTNAKCVINGGEISDNVCDNAYNGAVVLTDGASGVMNGGLITKTKIKNQYSGSVVVYNSSFIMKDGIIENGDVEKQIQSSGGVFVKAYKAGAYSNGQKASFRMEGGTIRKNSAPYGGGVYLQGGIVLGNSSDFSSSVTFEMTGGLITDNNAVGYYRGNNFILGGGGGVFVENGSRFTLTDGEISKNKVTGFGGGVATYDGFVSHFGKIPYENAGPFYNGWPYFFPAEFIMNGGKILDNQANGNGIDDRGCGGGVYCASDNVVLNAGEILRNTASEQGGGVYVGSEPYGVKVYNALIQKNNASVIGGGAWFCPTGSAKIYVTDGAAIFDNDAVGAADDLAILRNPLYTAYLATISDRMLGGGLSRWCQDGSLTGLPLGVADASVPRYNASNEILVSNIKESRSAYALKSAAFLPAKQLAKKAYQLLIEGNSARRGGGIGSNGSVTIGRNTQTISIQVLKEWQAGNANVPGCITVNLMVGASLIESVELNAANQWRHTFMGLPMGGHYTVQEAFLPGWEPSYTKQTLQDGGMIIRIMNRYHSSEVPQTGDRTNVSLMVLITLASGAILLLSIVRKIIRPKRL